MEVLLVSPDLGLGDGIMPAWDGVVLPHNSQVAGVTPAPQTGLL